MLKLTQFAFLTSVGDIVLLIVNSLELSFIAITAFYVAPSVIDAFVFNSSNEPEHPNKFVALIDEYRYTSLVVLVLRNMNPFVVVLLDTLNYDVAKQLATVSKPILNVLPYPVFAKDIIAPAAEFDAHNIFIP